MISSEVELRSEESQRPETEIRYRETLSNDNIMPRDVGKGHWLSDGNRTPIRSDPICYCYCYCYIITGKSAIAALTHPRKWKSKRKNQKEKRMEKPEKQKKTRRSKTQLPMGFDFQRKRCPEAGVPFCFYF